MKTKKNNLKDMASYQSEELMKAFPHQQNIGFDLGNIEIKERGLKSNKQAFSIRGKDWKAEYILFIDRSEKTFYLVKGGVTALGKRPKNRNDERKVSQKRVRDHAFYITTSEKELKAILKHLINPRYKEILLDLDSPNFSIFKHNLNEIDIELDQIPMIEKSFDGNYKIMENDEMYEEYIILEEIIMIDDSLKLALHLISNWKDHYNYSIVLNNEVIGNIDFQIQEPNINNIEIKKQFQKNKYGELVYRYIENLWEEDDNMIVELECYASARGFWEKMGYEFQYVEDYRDKKPYLIIMEKEI